MAALTAVAVFATSLAVLPGRVSAEGAPVTGSLWVDFNRDGDFDAGETAADTSSYFPPAGITITAYDIDGNTATGFVDPGDPPTYSIDVSGLVGTDFVVTYELDPADVTAGYTETFPGTDQVGATRVVSAGDISHFGILPPSECPRSGTGADSHANAADGKVWTTCFTNGDRSSDPPAGSPDFSLLGLNNVDGNDDFIEQLGNRDRLGSIWGLAYDEWSGTLYTSSFLKRHSELPDADQDGDNDLGGLMWLDYSDGLAPTETVYGTDLSEDAGGPTYGDVEHPSLVDGSRDVDTTASTMPSFDSDAFALVGATGIGDIDLTPDGRTLLVMNLETKSLDLYDVSSVQSNSATGAPVFSSSIAMPDPGCSILSTTPAYQHQPFGVTTVDGDTALVGIQCADNLLGAVYEIALPGGAATQLVTLDAAYYARADRGVGLTETWNSWTDDFFELTIEPNGGGWPTGTHYNAYRSQPLISDINVSSDGSMDITLMDRSGHQIGWVNRSTDPTDTGSYYIGLASGDTLYVCANGALEGTAGCPVADSAEGFYTADIFPGAHHETTVGGAWVGDWSPEHVTVQMDAPDAFNAGGIMWWPRLEDSPELGLTDFYSGVWASSDPGAGFFLGKAAGMGDVEGCNTPQFIGDYVWLDADSDGIQDPDEQPLAEVSVTLSTSSGPIATTETDGGGHYSFTSADGVLPNSDYTIEFDVGTASNAPSDPTQLVPTLIDQVDELRDSDIDVDERLAVTTLPLGINQSDLDAGYVAPLVIGDYVWFDADSDGIQDLDESGIGGVTVSLYADDGVSLLGTAVTDSDGFYRFSSAVSEPAAGNGDNVGGGLPADQAVSIRLDNPDDYATGPLTSYRLTDPDQTSADPGDVDDEVDSDAMLVDGFPQMGVPAQSDGEDLSFDAGFVLPPLRTGNIVWFDDNNDGRYDLGESPIEGVVVELYPDVGNDGIFVEGVDDVGPALSPDTPGVNTTGSDGRWHVDGLAAGTYFATIASGQTATIDDALRSLDNYLSSSGASQDPGPNTTDNIDDGQPVGSYASVSGLITLANGALPQSEVDSTSQDAEAAAELVTAESYADNDSDLTVDFGFAESLRVGSTLFLDQENDGAYNNADTALEDVIVQLLDADSTIVATTETDASGFYFFDGLEPNVEYLIGVPADQSAAPDPTATTQLVASTVVTDDIVADNQNHGAPADGFLAVTAPFTLAAAGAGSDEVEGVGGADTEAGATAALTTKNDANSYLGIDIGLTPFNLYQVGNQVWFDTDNNGMLDGDEVGIDGVLVQLVDDDTAVVDEVSTASGGFYSFTDLPAGTYAVRIPDDQSTADDPTALDDLVSSTGHIDPDDVDDGTAPEPSDDQRDNGEPVSGIARSASAPFVLGDPNGQPADDGEPVNEIAEDGVLPDGQSDFTVDFGFYQPHRLGNLVWEDFDDDGAVDPGEPGIDGVEVALLDADGEPVRDVTGAAITDTTDNDGHYEFSDLIAGTYEVAIVAGQSVLTGFEAGGISTGENEIDNDNNANGDSAIGWTSGPISLGLDNGEPTTETDANTNVSAEDATVADDASDLTVDFGFHRGQRLGGQIWLDEGTAQNDGVFDSDENAIVGLTTELWLDDGDDVFEPDDDTRLDATPTDGEGNYVFAGVRADDAYFVAVVQGTDDRISSAGASSDPMLDDNVDDGTDSAPAGYVTVSDSLSLAGPGLEPTGETDTLPLADETESDANVVTDFYPDDNSNLQIDFGLIEMPLFRLGNLVWVDNDGDGLAEPGEPALPGITVELYDSLDQLIDSDTTDDTGHYEFTNLAAETYTVSIPLDQATLAPYRLNSIHEQTDETDNNNDGITVDSAATSAAITLGENGYNDEPTDETLRAGSPIDDDSGDGGVVGDDRSDMTIDFGFYALSLGNQVFLDLDNDGQFEPGDDEIPIEGVQVNLLDGDGEPVQDETGADLTAVTDEQGLYLFTALENDADYIVEIDGSNFGPGQPLNDHWSSTGTATDIVADGEDDGVDPITVTGDLDTFAVRSSTVTMQLGQEREGEDPDNDPDTADDSEDLTVDFGFYSLSLGDTVFHDIDNSGDDNGGTDAGLAGVELELWLDDGDGTFDPTVDSLTDTSTTGAAGQYRFEGLIDDAEYFVVVAADNFNDSGVLDGFRSSTDDDQTDQLDGTDDGIDPTANDPTVVAGPVTADAGTEPEELGQHDPTVDVGFYTLSLGNQVWYDVDASATFDDGETPVEDVVVNLIDADTGEILDTATTDAFGAYLFTGLVDGQAYVVEIPAENFDIAAPLDGWFSSPAAPAGDDGDDNGIDPVIVPGDLNSLAVRSAEVIPEAGVDPGADGDGVPPVNVDTDTDTDIDGDDLRPDSNENLLVDFGFYQLAVGNLVWLDIDNSGTVDDGEEPVPGVIVNLLDASGDSVLHPVDGAPVTATTGPDGTYVFEGLPEGTYVVEIDAANFVDDGPLVGTVSSEGNDVVPGQAPAPDADPTDDDDNGNLVDAAGTPVVGSLVFDAVRAIPVALTGGEEPVDPADEPLGLADDGSANATVDFGFWPHPPFEIGSTIWFDSDNSGDGADVDGSNEPAADDVVVNLLVLDEATDAYVPAVDIDGGPVPPSTTVDGAYNFTGLPAGTYVVQLDPANTAAGGPLDGHSVSTGPASATDPEDQVDGNNDGLIDPELGMVSGPIVLAIDDQPTGEIDGSPNGTDDRFTDLTVDIGLVPTLELGDEVWIDLDNDGQLDPDEDFAPDGVIVNLLDAGGDVVGTTTTTDGRYRFDDLLEGDYIVELDAANFAADGGLVGYVASTGAASSITPNDDVDQNNDGTGEPGQVIQSGVVTLAFASEPSADDGSANHTVDFGVVPRLALGATIWLDGDNDGILDPEELPIPGVVVQLLDETGGVLAETATDDEGRYFFGDLDPGTYTVQLPASNFSSGGVLENYAPSTGPGANQNDNVDGNSDGVLVDGNLRSGPIVLSYGQEVAGNGLLNVTADFGLVELAQLAGLVWHDENGDGIQGPDEAGLGGVEVTLEDAAGVVMAEITAGDDGRFAMTGLPPEAYSISFVLSSLPAGATVTTADQGTDDTADSDANADARVLDIVLNSGDMIDNIAMGVKLPSPSNSADNGTVPTLLAFTGQHGSTMLVAAGLLIIAGGGLLRSRRRLRPGLRA